MRKFHGPGTAHIAEHTMAAQIGIAVPLAEQVDKQRTQAMAPASVSTISPNKTKSTRSTHIFENLKRSKCILKLF